MPARTVAAAGYASVQGVWGAAVGEGGGAAVRRMRTRAHVMQACEWQPVCDVSRRGGMPRPIPGMFCALRACTGSRPPRCVLHYRRLTGADRLEAQEIERDGSTLHSSPV